MLSYGSKSYWPIRLHEFSECSFSLTTWLFGMIIIDIPSVLEVLAVVLEIEKDIKILMPGPLGAFMDTFVLLANELPTQHYILIVGDFVLDQICFENISKFDPLIQNFSLSQRSQYSTHIQGGLLDFTFDTSNSNAVSFLPSSYSEHFVLFFQLYHHPSVRTLFFFSQIYHIYTKFNFQQHSFQS